MVEKLQRTESEHLEAKNSLNSAANEASDIVNQTAITVTDADGYVDSTTLATLRSARDDLTLFIRDHPVAKTTDQSSTATKPGGIATATAIPRSVDGTLSPEEIRKTALRLDGAAETLSASTEKINALTHDIRAKKTLVEELINRLANSVPAIAESIIAATANADQTAKTSLSESLVRLKDAIEKREPLAKLIDSYVAAAKAAQTSTPATEAQHTPGANTPGKGRGPKKNPDSKTEGPEKDAEQSAPPSATTAGGSPGGGGAPAPPPVEEHKTPTGSACKSKTGSGTDCSEGPNKPTEPAPGPGQSGHPPPSTGEASRPSAKE